MNKILLTTLFYFATSAAFAADLAMKDRGDHGDKGAPCDKANMPDQKARPKGEPPTLTDLGLLPKTTVVSADGHAAPPADGTTVEQPK
jgi:hypothetical protein